MLSFQNLPPELHPVLHFLKETILKLDVEINTTTKYGMPCFVINNKPFCYLWYDKKTLTPYILFTTVNNLNHDKLLQNGRKKMKSYFVNPNKDIDINELNSVLKICKDLFLKINHI